MTHSQVDVPYKSRRYGRFSLNSSSILGVRVSRPDKISREIFSIVFGSRGLKFRIIVLTIVEMIELNIDTNDQS